MQWRDPFTGIFAVLYPMFFATVAFLMFRVNGGGEALLYAALGVATVLVLRTMSRRWREEPEEDVAEAPYGPRAAPPAPGGRPE